MRSRFLGQPPRSQGRWAVVAVVAALVAAGAFWGASVLSEPSDQAASSVCDAVLDAALQCQAVEGAYPSGLTYLEDHYGLRVNENDYVVAYEWFASNVPPTVSVRARGEGLGGLS